MKLTGTKSGCPLKLITDEKGRTRAVVDTAAQEAKLDVSTRIQKRKSKRVKVVKRGGE